MKTLVIIAIAVCVLASCSSKRLIVDTKGVDMSRYGDDLVECQEYAEQVPVGEEVAKGAARGGIIWGAIGAIFGNSRSVARSAGAGAVTGAAHGGAKAGQEKREVVKTCMHGRGYKVLN